MEVQRAEKEDQKNPISSKFGAFSSISNSKYHGFDYKSSLSKTLISSENELYPRDGRRFENLEEFGLEESLIFGHLLLHVH